MMNFYDEMRRLADAKVYRSSCELKTVEVHIDENQAAGMTFDDIFEEFLKTTEWPRQCLKFAKSETSSDFKAMPSAAMMQTPDGTYSVTAFVTCERKEIKIRCSTRPVNGSQHELTIGSYTLNFDLNHMTFCPPFAPAIIISIVGSFLVKGVVKDGL